MLHNREVGFILNNSDAKLLLYDSSTASRLTDVPGKSIDKIFLGKPTDEIDVDKFWSCGNGSSFNVLSDETENFVPFEGITPSDLLSINFTSGTTGQPKGVAHSAQNLFNNATEFNKKHSFSNDTRMYHVFTMAYMAGFLNTLISPFMCGGSVVISHAFGASTALRFWEAPIKYEVNTLWLVPTILKTLLLLDRNPDSANFCRDNISNVCCGTAPLSIKLKQDFEQKYGVDVHESYGLSELLYVTTNNSNFPFIEGSVGEVLENVEVYAFDDSGKKLPPGDEGELFVYQPDRMNGYLDFKTQLPDPETSPEWFPTGDIGYISSEGHLFITDRKKDLIVRGGFNISPRSVEKVLDKYEGVSQSAVVGISDEYFGETITAALIMENGGDLNEKELKKYCHENLSDNAIPTKFYTFDKFPLGSTGKVLKTELKEIIKNRK